MLIIKNANKKKSNLILLTLIFRCPRENSGEMNKEYNMKGLRTTFH